MLGQILNLTWKELIQIRRDRFLVVFLVLAPALQLVLLSRNTSRGVVDLPVAVLDLNQSALSRELAAMLDETREMQVLSYPHDRAALELQLEEGTAQVGIVIPPDFERDFYRQGLRPAQVQVLLDGSNILVGRNGGAVVEGVIAQLARSKLQPTDSPDLGGVHIETSAVFNPAFDYRWFSLPSMLAFITYQVALVVAATGFVREKELGTLEQLVITPINRFQLIAGKALPAVIVALFNFILLLAVIHFGYDVPMRGNLGLLLGLATLFIIAVVGQGTVISVLTHTQQQAVLLVFLLAILEVTLSGYLLPVENMPVVMRWLAQISAIQHFMVINRAVILRGATLPMLAGHAAAMFAFGVAAYTVAWRTFTRSI